MQTEGKIAGARTLTELTQRKQMRTVANMRRAHHGHHGSGIDDDDHSLQHAEHSAVQRLVLPWRAVKGRES